MPKVDNVTATGARVLVLYNLIEDDVYEALRAEGPTALAWDPERQRPKVNTVAEEFGLIVTSLRGLGHHVELVNIGDDLGTLLGALAQHQPDVVFNLIEFFGDDLAHEAHVAGVFELLGIAYTGNRPEVLALCQKKHRTKAVLAAAGVPTAPYLVVGPGEVLPAGHPLRFPVIVKPAMEDASGGIDASSVITDPAALAGKVAAVQAEFGNMPILVEEFIDGREIHCAVLGDPVRALPLWEMEFFGGVDEHGAPLPKIITYKGKWDPDSRDFHGMDGRCPVPDLGPDLVARIQATALDACRAVGIRDYARVDMRLDAAGVAHVLEVNPNPDLSDECAFWQCAQAANLTYPDILRELIDAARARAPARGSGLRAPAGATDELLRQLRARG